MRACEQAKDVAVQRKCFVHRVPSNLTDEDFTTAKDLKVIFDELRKVRAICHNRQKISRPNEAW
jgi:thymidine kinase